jgi:hypothetical protein
MWLPADNMDELELHGWISISSMTPAGTNIGGHYQKFHLIHDINRQQHRWTTPEAVNTVTCSC